MKNWLIWDDDTVEAFEACDEEQAVAKAQALMETLEMGEETMMVSWDDISNRAENKGMFVASPWQ